MVRLWRLKRRKIEENGIMAESSKFTVLPSLKGNLIRHEQVKGHPSESQKYHTVSVTLAAHLTRAGQRSPVRFPGVLATIYNYRVEKSCPGNKRKQLCGRRCVDICDEAFDDGVRNRNVHREEKTKTMHGSFGELQLESIIDVILIQFDEFQRVRPEKRPVRSKPGSFFLRISV
ncbi:hypothetical protein F2P79_021313 [Pimephales promelas]|nr:hypothetical protein F2P79_021313 [Pimephales promelas]